MLRVLRLINQQRELQIIGLVVLIAILLLLFLPFGVRLTPLVEEWTGYAARDRGQFIIPTSENRPLFEMSLWIGALISPNAPLGLGPMLFVWLVGKGVVVYLLALRLFPETPSIGMAAGILTIIYPSDTSVFGVRYLAHHASLFFYLLATYLYVRYWERPAPYKLGLIQLCLLISVLTVEIALPAMIVTPVVLVWLERGVNAQVVKGAIRWYIMVGVTVAVFALLSVTAATTPYQASIAPSGGLNGPALQYALQSVGRAYYHNLLEGWQESIAELVNASRQAPNLYIALAIGILAAWAVWLHSTWDASAPFGTWWKRFVPLLVVGLILIGLGFAPFMLLPTHQTTNARVFLISSLGALLIWVALLFVLSGAFGRSRVLFAVGIGVLGALASLWVLRQHQTVADYARQQQIFLGQLADLAPDVSDTAVFVFFDAEGYMDQHTDGMFGTSATNTQLSDALRYLYRKPALFAANCTLDCTLNAEQMVIREGWVNTTDLEIPYARIIALEYFGQSGKLRFLESLDKYGVNPPTYRPHALIRLDTPISSRLSAFAPVAADYFKGAAPPRMAQVDFTKQVPGLGWDLPSEGWRWTSATVSTLNFWLQEDQPYELQFRLIAGMTPEILNSLRLQVNDTDVPLTYLAEADNSRSYYAVIPKMVMQKDPDITRLKFTVDKVVSPKALGMSESTVALGVAFSSLRIAPQAPHKDITVDFAQRLPGTGWSGPEQGHRWTAATNATLNYRLAQGLNYKLEFLVTGWLKPEIVNSLQLHVNNTSVPLQYEDTNFGRIYRAVIPVQVVALDPDNTRLEFIVDQLASPKAVGAGDDDRQLGLAFSSLTITPTYAP